MPLALHVFLSMVMFLVWGIINNLQLITNINGYEQLKIPGQVIMLQKTILETVQFKLTDIPEVKLFIDNQAKFAEDIVQRFGILPIAIVGLNFVILLVLGIKHLTKRFVTI